MRLHLFKTFFTEFFTPNSLDDVKLLKNVLLDFGDMSVGIGVFVETPDHLVGTRHMILNVRWSHTLKSAYRGHNFGYLNDVCGGDIEVISFQREQLAIADEEVVTPLSMERM